MIISFHPQFNKYDMKSLIFIDVEYLIHIWIMHNNMLWTNDCPSEHQQKIKYEYGYENGYEYRNNFLLFS